MTLQAYIKWVTNLADFKRDAEIEKNLRPRAPRDRRPRKPGRLAKAAERLRNAGKG